MDNKYWHNKNVLVNGGTGFIGTWLVKELTSMGANVSCLTNCLPSDTSNFCKLGMLEKADIIIRDLSKVEPDILKKDLEERKIKAVFHLAGQSILPKAKIDPFYTIQLNTFGTTKVLEACRRYGIENLESIVITSSINAYGANNNHAYNETDALKGILPYEVSMSALDLITQSYAKNFNLPIGIARFSNIYGPGDLNFERLVPAAIKNILNNERIELKNMGDIKRGFLHVYDAVSALIQLAEYAGKKRIKGEAFNFGPDKTCKISDVVATLINSSQSNYNKLFLISSHSNEERENQFLNTKKAREILKWHPKISLERGLKDTFEWYKQYS